MKNVFILNKNLKKYPKWHNFNKSGHTDLVSFNWMNLRYLFVTGYTKVNLRAKVALILAKPNDNTRIHDVKKMHLFHFGIVGKTALSFKL